MEVRMPTAKRVSQGVKGTVGLPTPLSKKTMEASLEFCGCTVTEQYFSRQLTRWVAFLSVKMVEMKEKIYFCSVNVWRVSSKFKMKRIDNMLLIPQGNKYKDKIWQPVLFVSLVLGCGSMLVSKDLSAPGSETSRYIILSYFLTPLFCLKTKIC